MEVIDNTVCAPPPYVPKTHPLPADWNMSGSFKNKPEEKRYWDKEQTYWKEGFWAGDHYITGRHYFYMQECTLQTPSGKLVHPYWRDWDDHFFKCLDQAIEEGKDIIVGKGRREGLTSKAGGSIPLYESLMNPNTNLLMTSVDKERFRDMLNSKLKVAARHLDPHYAAQSKSEAGKKIWIESNRQDGVQFGEPLHSQVICKATYDNPTALEGYAAIYIFLDEIGLHKHARQVRDSVKPSLWEEDPVEGFKKIGYMIMGGTVGDMTKQGSKLFEDLWKDAESEKLLPVFIPGYAGKRFTSQTLGQGQYWEVKDHKGKLIQKVPNGHTDKEASIQWVNDYVESLRKQGDLESYKKAKKSYPITVDDMFEANAEDTWPEEVVNILNTQKGFIRDEQPPIQPGFVKEGKGGEVKFYPNPEGNVKILERPVEGISRLYVAGLDPIPFYGGDQGSYLAVVIYKRFSPDLGIGYTHDLPVAIYWVRSHESAKVAEEIIHLLRYYNNAKCLLELNGGGEVMHTEFKNYNWIEGEKEFNAFSKLLAKRPTSFDIKFGNNELKKGVYVNGRIKEHFDNLAGKNVRKYGENIMFEEIIDDTLDYEKRNTDFFSAFRLAVAAAEDFDNKEAKNENKEVSRKKIAYLTTNSRGERVWDYKYINRTKDAVDP